MIGTSSDDQTGSPSQRSGADRRRVPVSLRDVATRAGVSMATASRVMNQPELVRPPLRQRVVEAAKELRYVPNPAARALARRRTMRIGAVIPTVDYAIFARFVAALTRRLRQDGYGLLVSFDEFDPKLEATEIHGLVAAGIDGMILVGDRRDADLYTLLESSRIPHVVTNILSSAPGRVSVGQDNRAAAELVAHHLLDLGHRHIGIIDAPAAFVDRAALRLEGVRAALGARALPPPAVVERRLTIADGRAGFRALMARNPEATAVICGNDVLGIGACLEARAMGLDVPGDVSITGFGGLEIAAEMDMGLTTVTIPMTDLGTRAAESLLALIAGRAAPAMTVLQHELVLGTTTAAPRSQAVVMRA